MKGSFVGALLGKPRAWQQPAGLRPTLPQVAPGALGTAPSVLPCPSDLPPEAPTTSLLSQGSSGAPVLAPVLPRERRGRSAAGLDANPFGAVFRCPRVSWQQD